jgi:hypothetical protein
VHLAPLAGESCSRIRVSFKGLEFMMKPTSIQTRSETTGIQTFLTFQDALIAAQNDESIWKISFEISDGSRIRLIRENNQWVYENVMTGFRN